MIEYSAVVPCHNESGNLPELAKRLDSALKKTKKSYEIIIVNDNSTDNSKDALDRLKKEFEKLRYVERRQFPGVGNAKRDGFKEVKGKYIITLDGDLSHDPAEIPRFIEKIKDYDMVCGSRYARGGEAEMGASRKIISGAFNFVFRTVLGIPIRDFTSGFRIYKSEIIKSIKLKSSGFGIYIEIPLKAYLKGYRLAEIPIKYYKRMEGKSNLNYLRQGPEYIKVACEALLIKLHLKKI
jgi:glycosyltransferase involved in cell wall biosynthesis